MTRMHDAPDFEFSFPSGDLGTREALTGLRDFLGSRAMSEDLCGSVELAIAEVLNNVVEHAYAEGAGDAEGVVTLLCWHSDNELSLLVRDHGAPMPGGKIPLGRPPDIDVEQDALPEGGFGWYLIRELVREIRYLRDGKVNELFLRFDVTPAE